MPNYRLTAVNVGSISLGESDRVITLFSAEQGLVRAVAKGVRKPGAKIGGRADLLNVNNLLLATGRSLDIIVQAEQIESFPNLRRDLSRLSYGLYYAELAAQFGQGLSEEADLFFVLLREALRLQADDEREAALLCLDFELRLLDLLGYKPEIDFCVVCREVLTDFNLGAFDHEQGGIVCDRCLVVSRGLRRQAVAEDQAHDQSYLVQSASFNTHITPLVWQGLVLASRQSVETRGRVGHLSANIARANAAACRLIQMYIEYKAGRRMKALDLLRGHRIG